MRLKFSDRMVSSTGWCVGECRDSGSSFGPPRACEAAADSVRFGGVVGDFKCRAFKKDSSKLIYGEAPWHCHDSICENPAGSSEFQAFFVYARDQSGDSLEGPGALLKPFVPTAPVSPKLVQIRKKD